LKIINIAESVNLHLIQTEKFKTTTICILIRRPLLREEVTYNALITNVIRKGSKRHNSLSKLNAVLENMYGAIFDTQVVKMGEEQIIQLYIEILNKDIDEGLLDQALEFLRGIIFNPLLEGEGFKEEVVKIEKENLKNKINGRINNKVEYVKSKCIEKACAGEAFSLYGDGYIEDLEQITAKNLYNHFKNILKTSPIEFLVMGNEGEEVSEKIKELFSFGREGVIQINKAKIVYDPKKVKEVTEKQHVNQGKLCMALRTGIDPTGQDFYSLLLLNEVLGATASSKLFMNVRERESLCYSISSFIYRFKGILMIQAGVDSQNFDKTLELINKEIENMANGDITEKEIGNAKKSITKNLESMKDYAASTINFYISQYMLNDEDDIESAVERVKKVTKEDIQNCAKKIYTDTIYLMS